MTTALTVPGAVDLADLTDVEQVATLIYYMGYMDLGSRAPIREYKADEATGEIIWLEPAGDYVARTWPELKRADRGMIVRAGLQQASRFRDQLTDGIQLVVYRARREGLWLATDDAGGGDDKAFREWVKAAVTDDGGSTTEATQMASTILNLEFLAANHYKGLPGNSNPNIYVIFQDRNLYNRWRRPASGLRRLIDAAKERPKAADVRESIQEIVDAINDPDKTLDDLDRLGRAKPTLPGVTVEIQGRDDLGRHIFCGVATDAQLAVLKSKTEGTAQWILKGEYYGVTNHVLAEYRTERNDDGIWRREFDEGRGKWGDFDKVDEIPEGYPEGVPFSDPDWGTTYVRQWEVKES